MCFVSLNTEQNIATLIQNQHDVNLQWNLRQLRFQIFKSRHGRSLQNASELKF